MSVCPAQQTLLQFPSTQPNSSDPIGRLVELSQLAYLNAMRLENRVDVQLRVPTVAQRLELRARGLRGPLPVVAHIRSEAYRSLAMRLVNSSFGYWQRVQCSLDDTSASLMRENRLSSTWFLLRSVVTDRSVARDKEDKYPPYNAQLPSQQQWFVLSNVVPNFDSALSSPLHSSPILFYSILFFS